MRTSLNATLPDLRQTLELVTGVAIIETDLNGYINFFNTGAEKLLGFSKDEVIGHTSLIFHMGERVISFLTAKTGTAETNKMSDLYDVLSNVSEKNIKTWTFLKKEGRLIKITLNASAIKDESDAIVGYLLIANDVSHFIQVQRDLKQREEKVKTLVNNLKEGIFQTDNNARITELNSSWVEITGYSFEQSLGFSILNFIHNDDQQSFQGHLCEILIKKVTSKKFEKRLIKKDGSYLWMEFDIQSLTNEKEEVEGLIGSFRNITEKLETETSIHSTLNRFSTIIHYMQEGILAEDAERKIVLVNEKLCNVFNLKISAEFLKGTSSKIFMDQIIDLVINKDVFFNRIEELIKKEEPKLNEEIVLTDGRILERDYIPIHSDKKYNGHLWQYRDITKRKKQEKELVTAKENAIKSVKAKDMFLSTMSHEIRTPLNAVIGMTHLLLEESPKPEQVENLKTLKFSAENLMVLINDILDYNKIDAGQVTFETIDFSIRDLVNGVKQSLMFRAEEKGISLQLNIDPNVPEVLQGDPSRLAQIINNLVSNALKFTDKGSVNIDISNEGVINNKAQIKFSITDTGIGIPADKLDYIFYSFTQASYDITRKFGGTGLGLAITKRLVKLQGGDIKVESELGKGSTFYITLKYDISASEHIAKNLNPYGQIIFKSLKGIKLLLVEDSPINKLVATKFLTKWDVVIEYAENGLEGVEKVKSNKYDLVLMDLQMPEMDGYLATETIRNLPDSYYKKLPIIALTASAMLDVKEQVFSAGMNDYLTKPFNPNELYLMISKYSRNV
ncbi:MAG TPA: PAS domain S-box protein [Cytophagales bacterium]|nr:PAS domain S-box protein [Cytophagales bacterium]